MSKKTVQKQLSPQQREELLDALKTRFEQNMGHHKGLEWAKVRVRLEASAEKLWSLNEMERTGGEPDVVGLDKADRRYDTVFVYHNGASSYYGSRAFRAALRV